MGKRTPKPPNRKLEALIKQKSYYLSTVQVLSAMGPNEDDRSLWAKAADLEGQIASLLDAGGEDLEAAVHRISAGSCWQKAGDPSRAANLYRAAMAGPLRDNTRKDVEKMLADCFALLVG